LTTKKIFTRKLQPFLQTITPYSPVWSNFFTILCKNPVCTSQETRYVSATKTNQLMLFRETIAVYCENHTKHTNTLCRQNAEFWYVKSSGTYRNCWALKD
jgi:hypothetical protein